MHEYSIVQELVEKLLAEISKKEITAVREVHVRRGSTFSGESLQQAFIIMTENTPLDGAQLIIEDFNVEQKCQACGYTQIITPDDLIGHLFVCPECGAAIEIDEAKSLQFIKIVY